MKLNKRNLAQQFAGADNPNEMGTTGLVAWVLHGLPDRDKPKNRWERFLAARQVIRKRGLSVTLFIDAVIATAYYYGINLKRFYNAVHRRGWHRSPQLLPEFYTWGN